MANFWAELRKPFFVLAPMEDVTDFVFREFVATYLPSPDVLFTEFTSSDGLVSPGFNKVVRKLKFSDCQRPIVAQVWGGDPKKLGEAARIVQDLGFDGIDLNLGCPERGLVKKGLCSGMIGNYSLASEIIAELKEGAPNLPISVKTRLGVRSIMTEEWARFLLSQGIQTLTLHGQIASQMSDGEANWEEIGKAVEIRDNLGVDTLIVGNGDVKSRKEGMQKAEDFRVDGIMIGRGIFHNPWVFEKKPREHTPNEKVEALLKHAELFVATWGKTKNFEILKKFFKMYCKDFDHAFELRQRLMAAKNLPEVRAIVSEFQGKS